jgi:excisionase family DNA binding protein
MQEEHKRLFGVAEASALTGIGRTTLYSELSAGRLASVKVGRRRLIPREALDEYVARLRKEAGDGE